MTKQARDLWEELNFWHAALAVAEDYASGSPLNGLCFLVGVTLNPIPFDAIHPTHPIAKAAMRRLRSSRPQYAGHPYWWLSWAPRVAYIRDVLIRQVEAELEAL
jgi:hypothetical protein